MRIMTSGLRGGRLKWRTDAAADDDADADAAHDEAQQARSAIVAVVEGILIAGEYCAPLGSRCLDTRVDTGWDVR
jgi:hypothetical protein